MAGKGPPALKAIGFGCTEQGRALEVTQHQPDLTGKGGGDLGRGQGWRRAARWGEQKRGCLCTLEVQPVTWELGLAK